MLLNIVYAWLVDGMDAGQRQAFDDELHAPPDGWASASARVLRKIDELAAAGQDREERESG